MVIYSKPCPREEVGILFFLLSNHIQMRTPFAVEQYQTFLSVLCKGCYARSFYERTFLSESIENHAISNELCNMLIMERSVCISIFVYLGVIVNSAEF